MSYNQPISNMNPRTQTVGETYNPVHGQQAGYNQAGMAPTEVGGNTAGYNTGLGNTAGGVGPGSTGYGPGVGPTGGYGAGVGPTTGAGTGLHQPGATTTTTTTTTAGMNKPRNPSMDVGLGKLEQVAGTLLSSQRMKDRGMQKEEAGLAARADAHAQVMQDHHIQRAERMEAVAGAHRDHAVGLGAHPDHGQLGGTMGTTGLGGRQGY